MSAFNSPTDPSVSPNLTFANYLPRQDFELIARHYALSLGDEYPDSWRGTYGAMLSNILEPALSRYLASLRDMGVLHAIPGGGGRDIPLLTAWNSMVDQDSAFVSDPRPVWDVIGDKFSHCIVFDAMLPMHDAHDAGEDPLARMDSGYQRMVARVDSGSFGTSGAIENERDGVTDEYVSVGCRGWQITMKTRTLDGLQPIQSIQRQHIVENRIVFETPQVLVADWFRIEAFNRHVERDHSGPTINSTDGRERATREHLANHGFLYACTGNHSRDIITVDGVQVFGYLDEELLEAGDEQTLPPQSDIKRGPDGPVCAITIIERARLVDIVAGSYGQEGAERVVDAYVADPLNSVIQMWVEPGEHYLYASGDYNDFTNRFSSPDLPLHPAIQPTLVLSPRKLTLQPRVEHGVENGVEQSSDSMTATGPGI